MAAPLLVEVSDFWVWFRSPVSLAIAAFTIWMLVDAVRRKEWVWVLFLLVFPGFSAFWYFFFVYRDSPSATRGFELPGAFDRKRIKELQAQIHHLDKPHHYAQLGDIYFQQGKLLQADACYRAALERDPQDIDTRAHFGQCLLRQNKPREARPLLEGVVAENPKHDYGHTLMALAETLAALGETDAAIATWQRVTENHSYARARVQLAELYSAKGQKDAARAEASEVVTDFPHTPAFQRKRDRVWVRRAKKLLRQIG
jgi:tetratricopeptide (TPR) repeat protein